MNLGKSGVGVFFDTFWYGTEYFEESGPGIKTSGRDLGFGRGGDGRGLEIWMKK